MTSSDYAMMVMLQSSFTALRLITYSTVTSWGTGYRFHPRLRFEFSVLREMYDDVSNGPRPIWLDALAYAAFNAVPMYWLPCAAAWIIQFLIPLIVYLRGDADSELPARFYS